MGGAQYGDEFWVEHVRRGTHGVAWHHVPDRPLERKRPGPRPPDNARRFRCFSAVSWIVDFPDDRPGLGDQYFRTRRRVHGPAELCPPRRGFHQQRRGATPPPQPYSPRTRLPQPPLLLSHSP